MDIKKLNHNVIKTIFLSIYFLILSLILEIAFFNKDFFYSRWKGSLENREFDYFWLRHLALFLILIFIFIIKKRKITVRDLKPYSGLFLLLFNILPGICFLSKYFFLFLSFLLILGLKSEGDGWKLKRLWNKNLFIIVFFLVLFILLFPLLFQEGYTYDPLSIYLKWPGYRLTSVPELRTSTGAASDLFDAFLPQWTYTYNSIRQGNFPLWRYNKGLGNSLYGQSYHPEKLISFMVEPVEALTLRVLLKLFLSMVGMYLLLKTINIGEIASMIGGIAYALSGFIIGWLHGPQSSVAYHIPFLFFFLLKYLKSKQKKFLLYFALWSSLTIYSGFIAVAGYSFYAVGLFLILYYIFDQKRLAVKAKELLNISVYWGLGILIMIFHFLPLYYSYMVSESIDISYRHIGQVFHLSTKYIPHVLFPFYRGWEITPEIRPYVSSVLILFLGVGFVTFIWKFIQSKKEFILKEKYTLGFFLVFLYFFMAMFGLPPFYQISCQLPVLRSSPLSRLQSITCFLLVILGVKGIDLFFEGYKKILRFFTRKKLFFIFLIEVMFLFSLYAALVSWSSPKDSNAQTFYPVFLFLTLVLLAFQISVFSKKSFSFFLILLLMIISGETIVQNRRYIPVNKEKYFISKVDVPLLNFIKKNSTKYDGILVFDSNYNINGTLGNYGLREKVVHKFYPRIKKQLILDTFSQQSFKTPTAPALNSSRTNFSSSFIQLLGVKYLIFPYEYSGDLPSFYRLVYNQADGKVYRNEFYRKNKGIFMGTPQFYDPQKPNEVIKEIKGMEPQKCVYLEKGVNINLDSQKGLSCDVDIINYSPNKVVYRYQAQSDGILTFPESFDDGWSVTVNGERRKGLRTNLIFRGVVVKEGRGEIVFRYQVPLHYKILVLAGIAFLISLVSLYFLQRKSEKSK